MLVRENLNIVIGVVVGVAALQLVGIIFAFCVCKVRIDIIDTD